MYTNPPPKLGTGWRDRVAQALLRLLYQNRWYYITPYKAAGVGAAVVVFCGSKVLLARRAGKVEYPGCWGLIGGFIELKNREGFGAGAVREFFEEAGLQIDAAGFGPSPDVTYLSFGKTLHEENNYCTVGGYYFRRVEGEEFSALLQVTSEADAFAWFDAKGYAALRREGKVPPDFTDQVEVVEEGFKRVKVGEKFPLLKVS